MRSVARSRVGAPSARPTELLVDLARPDSNWWFSFATDGATDLVEVLLEHPGAYRVPGDRARVVAARPAGRADPARVLRARLEAAPHRRRPARPDRGRARTGDPLRAIDRVARLRRRAAARPPGPQLDPDRLRARAARTGAGPGGRRSQLLDGPADSVALAAVQADGVPHRGAARWARRPVGRSPRRALDRTDDDLAGDDRGRRTRARRRFSCCSATTSVSRPRCASARRPCRRRRVPAADARVVAG